MLSPNGRKLRLLQLPDFRNEKLYVKYTIRADVVEENGEKYVILPRSKTFSTGTLDLLSYDEDYTLEEDVFREYKNQFLLALCKDYISEGNVNYSLYDYSSVVEIIKIKENL